MASTNENLVFNTEHKVPILKTENNLIDQEFDSVKEKFQNEMIKMEQEMSRFRTQLLASEINNNNRSLTTTPIKQFFDDNDNSSSSSSSSKTTTTTTSTNTKTSKRITTTTTKKTSTISSAMDESHKLIEEHQQKQDELQKLYADLTRRKSSQERRSFNRAESNKNWLNELNSPLIHDDGDGNGKLLKLRFDVSSYEPEQILVKTIDNRLQVHAKREEKSENISVFKEYNREFLLPDGINPQLIRSSLSADGVLTVEAPLISSSLLLKS